MKKKGLLVVMMISILSTSLVFAMGKVGAVDGGAEATETPQKANKQYSFMDVDRAKTSDEKRAILRGIIKQGPETNEDWAISRDIQDKHDAAFQLVSMTHTKEDIETIASKIFEDKNSRAKKVMLDAISHSPYKDITSEAFKKVAETDEDLFIRGFAVKKIIKLGYEEAGYEYLRKLFNYLDERKELIPNFKAFDYFKSSKMKDKVKNYLFELRDDQNKRKMIRCYAAIICHHKYKADLEPYYSMIRQFILNENVQENEVKNILGKIYYLSKKNDRNAKDIIEKASKSGNSAVKGLLEKWSK